MRGWCSGRTFRLEPASEQPAHKAKGTEMHHNKHSANEGCAGESLGERTLHLAWSPSELKV
eukprot:9126933-Pyramimonas_sp.AAC.1